MREMKFRGEQEAFPSETWERGKEDVNGIFRRGKGRGNLDRINTTKRIGEGRRWVGAKWNFAGNRRRSQVQEPVPIKWTGDWDKLMVVS